MAGNWRGMAGLAGAVVLGLGLCEARAEQLFRPLKLDGHYAKWLPASAGGRIVVSYAIATREHLTPGAANCGEIRQPDRLLASSGIAPKAFQKALRAAFARWQTVAAITFVEASSDDKADIVVGEQVQPKGFAFANVVLAPEPTGAYRAITAASVCLNPERRWKIGFDGNLVVYDLAHTLAHEIGHTIGLDHPSPAGQLMSYRYTETIASLTTGDVAGVQSLYGPAPGRMAEAAKAAIAITTTAATTTVARGLLPAAAAERR